MSDPIEDVGEISPEEAPLRTDNPENEVTDGYIVSPEVQAFETQADVPCVITATPGFEDGRPGYMMYLPYRAFFLDKETAKALGQYFTAE